MRCGDKKEVYFQSAAIVYTELIVVLDPPIICYIKSILYTLCYMYKFRCKTRFSL